MARKGVRVMESAGIVDNTDTQHVNALYQASCTEGSAPLVHSQRPHSKERVATTIGKAKAKERMDGREKETEMQKEVSTLPRNRNIMQLGQTMAITTMMIGTTQMHKRNAMIL